MRAPDIRASELVRKMLRRAYERALRPVIREQIEHDRLTRSVVFGPRERLKVDPSVPVWNALFNTVSGTITIEAGAFFGHDVVVATGTHDIEQFGVARQEAFPASGRDIVIRAGAWIATRAVVLGPCEIGEHAVVAAGAVVTKDVPPYAVVAGVPAKVVRQLDPARERHVKEATAADDRRGPDRTPPTTR